MVADFRVCALVCTVLADVSTTSTMPATLAVKVAARLCSACRRSSAAALSAASRWWRSCSTSCSWLWNEATARPRVPISSRRSCAGIATSSWPSASLAIVPAIAASGRLTMCQIAASRPAISAPAIAAEMPMPIHRCSPISDSSASLVQASARVPTRRAWSPAPSMIGTKAMNWPALLRMKTLPSSTVGLASGIRALRSTGAALAWVPDDSTASSMP